MMGVYAGFRGPQRKAGESYTIEETRARRTRSPLSEV